MAGTLETQTILHADVVGSTALENAIGRRAWQDLVRHMYGIARHAADAVRGTFLSTEGDGMWIAFDSSINAVTTSVRLMQAVGRLNRTEQLPHELSLRVGITTGDVEWNDDRTDCTGMARNLAIRLEKAAEPDQILCSEIIPFLAGSDRRHGFERVPSIRLKDFEDLAVFEVPWDSSEARASDLGLPSELTANAPAEFVGRSPEVASLAAGWERALLGLGGVVAVGGEAGLGKTALCHRLASATLGDGGVVLYGRVDEHVTYPYQPFVEAIRDYLRRASQVEIQTTLGPRASELSLIVPELLDLLYADPPRPRDADTQRHLLFEAVATWIRLISRTQPVLFVLDDLTWADEQTLGMARHLARRVADEAVFVLWTYRPGEANENFQASRGDMERTRQFDQIVLGNLLESEVVELVSHWPGIDVDPQEVWERTGGHPFFLREVLRDRHRGESGLSDRVKDVVDQRMARLDEQTRELLSAAAVLGVVFDEVVAGTALDLDSRTIAYAIADAEEIGLVRPIDAEPGAAGWSFAHAIVRDAIYHDLPEAQRRYLHRELGTTLESLRNELHTTASAADLAYHFGEGGRDPEPTIRYSTEAAADAQKKFAFDAAVVHYRRALAVLPREVPEEHAAVPAQLLFGLGVAQRRSGQPVVIEDDGDEVDTLLLAHQRAADLGLGELAGLAVLAGSRGMFTSTGEAVHDRLRALDRALDLLPDEDSELRVRLLATKSVELTFSNRPEEMRALSTAAVEMAQRLYAAAADDRGVPPHRPEGLRELNDMYPDDRDADGWARKLAPLRNALRPLIEALSLRLVTLWRKDTVRERLAIAERLDQLCQLYDRPQVTLNAATFGAQAAMEGGDFEIADRRMATISKAAAELRQPTVLGYALLRQAMRLSVDGQFAESERLAAQAYEYHREARQPDAIAFYWGQVYNVRYHQGRLAEIVDDFAEMADDYPGIVAFRAANALVAMELGDTESARRSLDAIYGPDGCGVPNDLNWMATTAFAAQAAAALGDKELSARLADDLEPWADVCVDNASTFFGSVEHFLALVLAASGRVEEAKVRFANAARKHEQFRAWVLLARTHLEWGELLATSPDADERAFAEDLLVKAMDAAGEYELGEILRRGKDALDRLRAVPAVAASS